MHPVLAFLKAHRPRVLGFLALSALSALVVLLGRRAKIEQRVVFPPNPPRVSLAIRDPLVRPDLTVMATLRRNGKRGAAVWMTVDSGATGVTLPATTYHSLGLDLLRDVRIRTEDARGHVLTRDAGLVPDLVLGPLVVNEVITAVGGDQHVLGQSILSHTPWEIDWDRGKLTLGAAPWGDEPTVVSLPLRREGDSEVVTVDLGGVPVDLVVDTGAFASTLPESVGLRAGLEARGLALPTVLRSVAGQVLVRQVFLGKARLGALGEVPLELAALTSVGRRAPYGLLGLDVLSRYSVRVEPGKRLWLKPRKDVAETVRERLARWSFLPGCAHPGCLVTTLEESKEDAVLAVTYEADVTRPVDVLLGCDGAPFQPRAATLTGDGVVHAPKLLRVRVPIGFPSEPASVRIRRGATWFGSNGAGCKQLAVIDLAPASLEPTDAIVDDPAGGSVAAGSLELAYKP